MLVNQENQSIICTVFDKGRKHDFKIFKEKRLGLLAETKCLGDKGYQEIKKYHKNSVTPQKKLRRSKLSPEDKQKNQELAQLRIIVEHVHRRLKIFRILAERYRNRHRRFGLRFNLIAGLHNYELRHTTSS